MSSYNSGISANPLMSPSQYGSAMGNFSHVGGGMPTSNFPGQQFNPAVMSTLHGMLTGLTGINNQQNGLQFQRDYATQNAQHLLDAQQARAQSGLGGYQYLIGQQGMQQQQQSALRQMLMGMFAPYLGLGG